MHIKLTSYHKFSPLQLAYGQKPNVFSFLDFFRCMVYVPITSSQHTKMGSQMRLEIYVGYDSSFIIKYLKPVIENVFMACFTDYHFDDLVFPTLRGEKEKLLIKAIIWNNLSYVDLRKKQSELKVQKIIHLQCITNQLPNTFTNLKMLVCALRTNYMILGLLSMWWKPTGLHIKNKSKLELM